MKIISLFLCLLCFMVTNTIEAQIEVKESDTDLRLIYILDTIHNPRDYYIVLVESNQYETDNLKLYADQKSFSPTDSVTINRKDLFEGSNGLFISKRFFHSLMRSSKNETLSDLAMEVKDVGYSSTGSSEICKNVFKKSVNIKNKALVVSLIYGGFFNKSIPNHMISVPSEDQYYLIYAPL